MKKLLVYLTVLVGMASFAQTGPKIEFKEETINYGEVEKGKDDNGGKGDADSERMGTSKTRLLH